MNALRSCGGGFSGPLFAAPDLLAALLHWGPKKGTRVLTTCDIAGARRGLWSKVKFRV